MTRPLGMDASKLWPSWQAPQARRLMAVFQLSALAAGARWHLAQLRTSCGYVVSYGCGRPAYVPPVSVSLSPMWILWMNTGKSSTASPLITEALPVQDPSAAMAGSVSAAPALLNRFWSLWQAAQ